MCWGGDHDHSLPSGALALPPEALALPPETLALPPETLALSFTHSSPDGVSPSWGSPGGEGSPGEVFSYLDTDTNVTPWFRLSGVGLGYYGDG